MSYLYMYVREIKNNHNIKEFLGTKLAKNGEFNKKDTLVKGREELKKYQFKLLAASLGIRSQSTVKPEI